MHTCKRQHAECPVNVDVPVLNRDLNVFESHCSYLLAGGLAPLAQLRFTYDPSLMSPGGLTRTCVFFGESEKSIYLCSTAFWLTL